MDGEAEEVAEKYRWWSWNVAKNEGETADKLLRDAMNEGEMQRVNVVTDAAIKDLARRHASRGKSRTAVRPAAVWPGDTLAANPRDDVPAETDILPVMNDVLVHRTFEPKRVRDVQRG